MSAKAFTSLQFNEINWKISILGEQVVLLEAPSEIDIEHIHISTHLIEEELSGTLTDIVPAYHSIALFTSHSMEEVMNQLANCKAAKSYKSEDKRHLQIPICYELGLDMEEVSTQTNLTVEEIIDLHLKGTYRSQFIGFTPGFVYADGLNQQLACPRKTNPRTRIQAGSVGIGGSQTGIYSLESPGGWNIIGRTPLKLFSADRQPPMLIEAGTQFSFERITKEDFEAWEN